MRRNWHVKIWGQDFFVSSVRPASSIFLALSEWEADKTPEFLSDISELKIEARVISE